jgi:hypothetical protein
LFKSLIHDQAAGADRAVLMAKQVPAIVPQVEGRNAACKRSNQLAIFKLSSEQGW